MIVDFLHRHKYQSFLPTETMIFWWRWSNIPNVPKIATLQCLYNISKKKLEIKLIFCMLINIKNSNNLDIKVSYKVIWPLSMGMIKHSQSTKRFIQAILMSSRWHKKLNLLIEFSNSTFKKFHFKAYWCWTCIQNKLAS